MLGQAVGFVPASALIPDTSPSEEKKDVKSKVHGLCFLYCSAKGISSEADITAPPQAPRKGSMIPRPGSK